MKSYFVISNSQKFVKTVEGQLLLINERRVDSLADLEQEGVGGIHAAFWPQHPELLRDACRNYSPLRRGNEHYIGYILFVGIIYHLSSFVALRQCRPWHHISFSGILLQPMAHMLGVTADRCAGILKLHWLWKIFQNVDSTKG